MATRLTTQQFIEKATQKHAGKYSYEKAEYVNTKTKITITCPVHGLFDQEPEWHLFGQGCPICPRDRHRVRSFRSRKTTNQFINLANKIHGHIYDYSKVNFCGSKKNVTIICPTHGEFCQKAIVHLSKSKFGKPHGCPKCKSSSGEERIQLYLTQKQIPFQTELRLTNCRDKKPLPFDVGIQNRQGKLLGLIEFQGKHHYLPVTFGCTLESGEKKLKNVLKHDAIKESFCINNSIPLLTIPYTKQNEIESIIEAFLGELTWQAK